MATLPNFTALGERPLPRPANGVATYQPQQSNLGQEMVSAGAGIGQAAQIIEATNQKQDDAVAKDAVNKLHEAAIQLEVDPKIGFTSVSGEKVVGNEFRDQYADKFTQASSKLAEGLQNDNQRRIFQQHADVLGLQYQASLLKHQSKETKAFNNSTSNARIDLQLRSMALKPDELTFLTGVAAINEELDKVAEREGFSKQVIDDTKAKYLDQAYETRIKALLHGPEADVDKATELYTRAKKEGARLSDGLLASIEHVGTQAKASVLGAQLADKYGYQDTGKALKEIDGMDLPPALKAATRAEVEHRHAVMQSDADKAQALGVSKVMEMVYGGAPMSTVLRSPEYVNLRDKGAVLKAIQDKQYTDVLRANAFDERRLQVLRRKEAELHIASAAAAYRYMDPEVLHSTPRAQIEAMLPVLGQEWTKTLLDRKDSFEKKGPQDAKVDANDMVAIMDEMGLKASAKTKTDEGKALITITQSRIERMLTQLQSDGKVLSREQKNAIMRQEVAKTVTVDGLFWNTAKPIVELTPDELKKVVVPPQEATAISAEMADLYKRSGGKLKQFEPTLENLRRYYLTYRKGSGTVGMIPRVADGN